MSIIDKIWIKITSNLVGSDENGNSYYESKKIKDYLGKKRRYVVYHTKSEPSLVSPSWHSWLHHLTDDTIPRAQFEWQKSRTPNATGTKEAYKAVKIGEHRQHVSSDYQSWKPTK